jgi:hypothetical protein
MSERRLVNVVAVEDRGMGFVHVRLAEYDLARQFVTRAIYVRNGQCVMECKPRAAARDDGRIVLTPIGWSEPALLFHERDTITLQTVIASTLWDHRAMSIDATSTREIVQSALLSALWWVALP